MLWRRRESSIGRYTSCKKLAIDRSIGVKLEKVISGHSLLGLMVLTLRNFLRDVRATLPYYSQRDSASYLARLVPLVTSGRLILDC